MKTLTKQRAVRCLFNIMRNHRVLSRTDDLEHERAIHEFLDMPVEYQRQYLRLRAQTFICVYRVPQHIIMKAGE
jgi:hypothetical protein